MKYIVAVSGGVDSVALLDMLTRENKHELIIAHFDHGIRKESDADARFAWELAKKYGLKFEVRREELGENTSEALARTRRYAFLRDIAKKYEATIVTAHHQDDLIETIAINLTRGTGWRGLAVFANSDIERPLLDKTKTQLYGYALHHNLEWIEDETNNSDTYLRNRLRRRIQKELQDETRNKVLRLWEQQCHLRMAIKRELDSLPSAIYNSRYFFTMVPEDTAMELLEHMTHGVLTRPQITRLLLAIKMAKPHTRYEPGGGLYVEFGMKDFSVISTMKPLSELI